MRVITGAYKGRKLKAVPGSSTRPTTDKIKESVFQMMGPFFEDGTCLDLFAGSGSLGIEALSRGMTKAVFIDQHPKAVQTIKENLAQIKVTDEVEVFKADAFRALQTLQKRALTFDLILLDPPYKKVDYIKLVHKIIEFGLINHDGYIYCEHDPNEHLPEETDNLKILKQTNYSKTIGITIYTYLATVESEELSCE